LLGVDTNILVRFLVDDDEKQSKKVYQILKSAEEEKELLYVTSVVILELIWVLESIYKIERHELLDSLADLILMPIFSFENIVAIQGFLPEAKSSKYDLSDLYIAYSCQIKKCTAVLTFDRKASKHPLFKLA
jgi:predicted nucleic-acid-binding protein